MKLLDFFKIVENFADGKNPGRKGLAKRSGVNTKASVSSLRKTAKNSSGEKQRMAHWLANMKAGRAKKKANESIDVPEFKQVLQVFLPVAKQILELDKIPTIILKKRLLYGDQPSMGGFNLDTYELEIAIANRQPVDILRTLAHELVHAKQSTMHTDIDGTTGSPHEDEANAIAGRIMREFNKLHPEFLTLQPVTEGGNLQVGDKAADTINLQVQNRTAMVKLLDELLHAINNAYAKQYKQPLWSPELIQSREFLSGSSLHFFNVKGIPDETFVAKKPKVGDIDTQVDRDQEQNLNAFLTSITGKQLGPATFVGFQRGNEQYSSLWEFQDPPIKIQLDLEFVEYAGGKPTEWSQFSHSSSWDDLQQGIKGVFHKYLMRD
jgi:Zn-dependent peptidase ImmA (M78 family)